MSFKIGDRVVHPQYGIGHIVKLEEREFELGMRRSYYEISIPGGSTVWVPLDLATSKIRRLALQSEIILCRKILQSRPSTLIHHSHLRPSELVAHLRQGTIAAHCEVVRDLSDFVAHKPMHGPIVALLEAIQNVLCQEWAIVEGISDLEAVYEINSLLEKSRLAVGENKT